MKKLQRSIFFTFAVVLLSLLFAGTYGYAFEIEIDVAPNVLNIQSQSEVVTVHTDIAFSLVLGLGVTLNDIPIHFYKSDDRGYFVAKFLSDEVKNLYKPEEGEIMTLKLEGTYFIGVDEEDNPLYDPFWGTQDILVMNNLPAGKN